MVATIPTTNKDYVGYGTTDRGDWIETISGAHVSLLNPNPDDIEIEDIAYALSNICRFTGHTYRFYSVAEHSLYVSYLCSNAPLEGLLHDAAEAYLGDVSRPLKQLLPDYRRIEENFKSVINKRFNLKSDVISMSSVKAADNSIGTEEALVFLPNKGNWVDTRLIRYVIPDEPKRDIIEIFTKRFHQLRRS